MTFTRDITNNLKAIGQTDFATLRSAELGFLGVVVYTRVHTPRFCGHASIAGTLFRFAGTVRGLRINWLIVGIICPLTTFALRPDAVSGRHTHAHQIHERLFVKGTAKPEDHGRIRGLAFDLYSPLNPTTFKLQYSEARRLRRRTLLTACHKVAGTYSSGHCSSSPFQEILGPSLSDSYGVSQDSRRFSNFLSEDVKIWRRLSVHCSLTLKIKRKLSTSLL